ncbi:SDR family NAD(P)-dependent oxidoreductase [Bosea sp. RCC_152_1]|uniref:SDR family NAD(P)-dependent oxidoreductase n=1 Tax=Bosea sp. RCC_152_1 TaxID=3239228 RepID=UPI003524E2C2
MNAPSPIAGAGPALGFAEWFRRGEHARVEAAIAGMRQAGTRYLRTHLSWAEYHAPGGRDWYDWLIPRLGKAFDLLPCVHYTPPSLSRTGAASGPPVRLKDYADFIDVVLTRYGEHVRDIELWNEPNNLLDWDWREDHDWQLFCEMIGGAAYWIQHRGWRAVLGGPSPFDAHWLDLMGQRGVLNVVSAVGFHGFPGTWDSEAAVWRGYDQHIAEARAVLARYNPACELWITEAGYSTWRNDEAEQVRRFREAQAAPAERLYWYGWQDIPRDVPVQEGLYFDLRHYHLGVTDAEGRPKLLRRLLETQSSVELDGVLPTASQRSPHRGLRPVETAPVVIFGGAGFIGANLAERLLRDGERVLVFDNLSRPGVERNLAWLRARHGSKVETCLADIRDEDSVERAVKGAKAAFHLAAQVAVTSSLVDPRHDFSVNAQGTLTILEALRRHAADTPLVFASTNKVYGALADIAMQESDGAYQPVEAALKRYGISENRPLDFCTPYGCSKGAADQYVLDYAHSYGLRTAVLRMSCIFGPRQFGTEDQGWVAHFLIKALRGDRITIFGDGKQVRDILHVADAADAYCRALAAIDTITGRAFNLGGGPANAVSLNTVLAEIGLLLGRDLAIDFEDWRQGDQPYFVADTRALGAALGWRPGFGWRDGLRDLHDWACHEFGHAGSALPAMAAAPTRSRRRVTA